jgi:hypothetical protein
VGNTVVVTMRLTVEELRLIDCLILVLDARSRSHVLGIALRELGYANSAGLEDLIWEARQSRAGVGRRTRGDRADLVKPFEGRSAVDPVPPGVPPVPRGARRRRA